MLLIINNCISKRDEELNLHRVLIFMKKYLVNYKLCQSIDDIKSINRQQVKGIIMTGSYLRVWRDYNHPKTLTSLYILTDYQKPSIIPIYGMCFSCQLAITIHGGILHQLPSTYRQFTHVLLDNNIDVLHTHRTSQRLGEKEKVLIKVGFNDLPIPTYQSSKYFKETSWDLSNSSVHGSPLAYKYKGKPWYFSMYHPEAHVSTYWIFINFIQNICHETIILN